MRICLVYDCLFPHTIGGAERWYRHLAERLAEHGHEITYLTLQQWDRGVDADFPGVRVVPVGPRMRLYASSGRRRILPPLIFGIGVAAHLLRHGSRYDVVHTCSFPYFSLIAAAVARRRHDFGLIVDWFEVWTRQYWRSYLGRAGTIGWVVQRLCARVPQRACCFSQLHAQRLRESGLRTPPVLLTGLYEGSRGHADGARATAGDEPLVVFAGRHIPEKRVPAVVRAIAAARATLPGLRGEILGDGPERSAVLRCIADHRLEEAVVAPGVVSAEHVVETLRFAACLVLPSAREGYGMIVIEAAAAGTPSVVVAGPDNAAVELIADGENGFVAASDAPDILGEAIERVILAGAELRDSTEKWYAANAERLSLSGSVDAVLTLYSDSAQAAESRE